MSRRRWVYTEGGKPLPEPVEVSQDFQRYAERLPVVTDLYMDGTVATDGTDIGTRAKRRAYMKERGLADAADYKQHWEKKAAEREAFRRGEDKTDYRPALAEMWDKLGRKR